MLSETQKTALGNMANVIGLEDTFVYCPECLKVEKRGITRSQETSKYS